MLRIATLLVAGFGLVTGTTADACSCVPYPTQAEADRAGETIYRDADLIVDATVGGVSAAYEAMCPASGGKPRPADIGRSMNADRPITVHRVLKGKSPVAPILAGADTTVYAQSCGVLSNSCEVGIASRARTILVLKRAKGARFEMMSYCALAALSQSTRGRALFATK